MFLVLIGMFYISSVLEKGLKWVVCSKHRSSENMESVFGIKNKEIGITIKIQRIFGIAAPHLTHYVRSYFRL